MGLGRKCVCVMHKTECIITACKLNVIIKRFGIRKIRVIF